MKQDLTLNVGTKYNGDGMKKLDSALKNSARAVGSAGRAMSAMSNELGQLGGAAGKAAGAVSGLFSSLMSGGPVAAVIAGIGVAVSMIVNAFQSAKERAKEAAEAIREGFDKALDKTLRRINQIKDALSFGNRMQNIEQSFAQGQAGIAQRESTVAIKNKYAAQKANAKTDFERAAIDAAEKRDLALDDAKYKRDSANSGADDAKKTASRLAKSYDALTKEVEKQSADWQKFSADLENSDLMKVYKMLENGVAEAAKNSGTAGQSFREAVNALNAFKKENEDFVKDLAKEKELSEKLLTSRKELAEISVQMADANNKAILATRNQEVAQKEYATAVKAAKQQYSDDIKNAKKVQKQKDDADKKQLEAAKKQAEREKKLQERKALQDEKDKINRENAKTAMQQLEERRKEIEAAKTLAEAEKKAADILKSWNPQDPGANLNNNLNDWRNGQNGQINAANAAQANQDRNRGQAEREANRLAGNIFNKDGGVRGGTSPQDLAKLAQTSDFLGFKNLKDDQLKGLQEARDKLKDKLFDKNGNLKNPNDKNSARMHAFQRLDKALGKLDKVKEAERLKKEQEQRENKKAQDLDICAKKLQSIDDRIKQLGV